jgi:hypothetical protein
MGIRYDPAEDLNIAHFRAVRCLFIDLHLVDGQASSDERRHFALIAQILEANINEHGGPFVLVVWTEHPHLSNQLQEYLDASLDPEKPHARPLAVLSLEKAKFIDVENGDATDPSELRRAVEDAIKSNAQLAALLSWETEVLYAAADTLASLLNLVPSDKRTSIDFPSALDTILSRLARETVGSGHVADNPRAAITTALAPILGDRIMNRHVPEVEQDIWRRATTRHDDPKLESASTQEAGEINRMLHLAVSGSETLRATDWGAVVSWPLEWDDHELSKSTGLTIKEMVCEEFRLRSSAIESVRPFLIRIGAACDYAQNNRGTIPYLFGFEIPESAERQTHPNGRAVKLSDAIWQSPVFAIPDDAEPFRLYIHFRFMLNHLPATCSDWDVRCRLREQLLMHLIASEGVYRSRPGIIQIPVK